MGLAKINKKLQMVSVHWKQGGESMKMNIRSVSDITSQPGLIHVNLRTWEVGNAETLEKLSWNQHRKLENHEWNIEKNNKKRGRRRWTVTEKAGNEKPRYIEGHIPNATLKNRDLQTQSKRTVRMYGLRFFNVRCWVRVACLDLKNILNQPYIEIC